MIELFEHNQVAYEAALSMLIETGKAAIVHPTGTGKSFIGFKLCEDFSDKTVCWLSPSEYIFKTQIENLKLASDQYEPQNIKFFTYTKLMNMSENEIAEIKPDLMVYDEFHRAGASQWSVGIQNLRSIYPDVPILGLSATNIRYLDNRRDMVDELFDGNVASEMTLGEAIVRGILNPPKYVLSVFSYQKDLEKYERRIKRVKSKAARSVAERYLEALRRALEQADGLDIIFDKHMTDRTGKYIVFCANFGHMQEMMEMACEWFSKVDPCPRVYHVYSEDPLSSKAFAEFKADNDPTHLRLLFCIDALNEGVHIEDISGVILLRPTVSPIIYKQQIGRALSASKRTNAVIFDIVMNIENLYSIDSVEEEMRIAMTYYRSLGKTDSIVNERFCVVDEIRDCIELFEKLTDTLTASWNIMYGYAEEYYRENGNLEVPGRYKTKDGYSLGQWVLTQRMVRKGVRYGRLGADRIAKLDAIGMVWENMRDVLWNRYFAEARKYYEEHGDLLVNANNNDVNGVSLGRWIANLRSYRKSRIKTSYLTPERIEMLDSIGMVWDVPDYIWERNYFSAMEYHRKHGDLKVPVNYVDQNGVRLGAWIYAIRSARRQGNSVLTDDQAEQLTKLGIVWRSNSEDMWQTGYAEACKYKEEHGNLNVPATFVMANGYRLGAWINRQRGKQNKLAAEKKQKLDLLGMVWQKENSWIKKFELVQQYVIEQGNIDNMPSDIVVNGVWLARWLSEQIARMNGTSKSGKTLTSEQIKMLESVGIKKNTSRFDIAWENNYRDAKTFYEANGHLAVPSSYVGQSKKRLSIWVKRQRDKRINGKLTTEQIIRLDEIGMIWECDDPWEIGFDHAREYVKEYGDLLPSYSYVCDDGYKLGVWISNQRYCHNSPSHYHVLSGEKAVRLEKIGMVWRVTDKIWNDNYELVCSYYREHGNVNIPVNYKTESGVNLYTWLCSQKRAYQQGKLKKERISKLAEIDFDLMLNDLAVKRVI